MAFPERMFEREMKMIKKTLIAIALVAFLATFVHTAQGGIEEFYFEKTGNGGHTSIKVEGKDKPTIRWPYEICYEKLDLCTIPIYMEVGMFVQIYECSKKKIILKQVSCESIGKESKHYPCYKDCEDLTVRSNMGVNTMTKMTSGEKSVTQVTYL